MTETKRSQAWKYAFLGLLLAGGIAPSVGCQVSVAGQTLPSPYYLHDDVQYFPAGPEVSSRTGSAERPLADSPQMVTCRPSGFPVQYSHH